MTTDLKELIARHRKSADAAEHEGFTGLADQIRDVADALEAATAPNIEPLRQSGFVPGSYFCFCADCGKQHTADKRAWRCLDCAEKRVSATADLCAVVKPLEWDDHEGSNAVSAFDHIFGGLVVKHVSEIEEYERYRNARLSKHISIRSASDVAAEARAGAIEAATERLKMEEGTLITNRVVQSIRALHDTDTLAAIERIKEQARQEERERMTDIIRMYPKPHSNRIIAAIR